MAWNDIKKAYDSVGHGWLNGGILLHRTPVWFCRVMAKLCRSWNTRVLVVTGKGRETSQPIRFNKGVHEKVGLSFHPEKEHTRIHCFAQGFCYLNLSGITKFKYAQKNWIMDSGGEVIWHHRSNGQFTVISIPARSVKTTGLKLFLKSWKVTKSCQTVKELFTQCLNHFHGRKCYRRLHGRRFTWQATAEWGEIFSLPILVKISSTLAPF